MDQRDQEAAQRAVEADLLPIRCGFVRFERAAVDHDLVQRFGVAQAVAAHQDEDAKRGDHQQAQDQPQGVALGAVRHRRAGIIGEG